MKTYDQEFVWELENGDRKAQKQLFEQLYPSMFRVCMRYVLSEAEAEDCVMRGFMKCLQQLDKFTYSTNESLFWWIRKVMVNESLMTLRKRNNFNMMPEENAVEVPVDAEVWARLEAADIESLIMKLPSGYRTVFSLHVIEGYDHKEIAEMLSISESTSKTQLFKARGKLRQLIEQMNFGYAAAGR